MLSIHHPSVKLSWETVNTQTHALLTLILDTNFIKFPLPPEGDEMGGVEGNTIAEQWGTIQHPDITDFSRALLTARDVTPRG